MNETFVTFHGWAGTNVRHRETKDVNVATVRVGVTPRIKKGGEWVDAETTWYTVTAWRTLADNLRDSVRKGDPVIVHGRLRSETWKAEDGGTSTDLHVEASLVGHDLTRGITHFIKKQRPEQSRPESGEDGLPEAPDPAELQEPGDPELQEPVADTFAA